MNFLQSLTAKAAMPAKEKKSLTAKAAEAAEAAKGTTIESTPGEKREDNAKYGMATVRCIPDDGTVSVVRRL